MSALLLVDHPTQLPAPLGEQNQDAETALYLIAFVVILPLALFAAPRLADAIAAGPNGAALSPLAGLLVATLAATVLAVRVSSSLPWGDGVGVALAGTAAWSAGAAAVLVRAMRPREWPALLRLSGTDAAVWTLAALLVFGTLLALTSLGSLSVPALVLGGLAAAGALALLSGRALPRAPRRWGPAFDAVAVLLLLLAVPNLVIFSPESAAGNPSIAFETGIIQFHQDFLLGPANQVLGGSAVLVDTASQYGVGPIYLMAGWFQLAPIGYGTFGFLDGALTALVYVAAYSLLRIAGTARPLAAAALALGVIALVFNLPYAVGALPQQGPLRFGLPMLVVLAMVAGARWPGRERATRAAALAVVGLSSIWALEGFAYTVAVFAALAVLIAATMAAGGRLRWLVRQAAFAAAACVCAHLLFAGATLAVTGELPDWGEYLAYLDAFLFGSLGDLTYDVSPWSPGLAVGATYMASAAAIVLLVVRHRDFVVRERTALLALTGTTAYGITLFSYFVDRSVDTLLLYVSLPVLLTGTLWLSLLIRSDDVVPRRVRSGGFAYALAVGVLMLAAAWPSVDNRFPESALAHAFPRGKSLRDAVHRLWHPPPLDPRAVAGQQLVESYMPGRHIPVLVEPDLGTEILVRSDRANELPFGDPWEDSFVPDERISELRRAVDDLRPGDLLLTDEDALKVLPTLRTPRSSGLFPAASAAATLALLQISVLRWIDRRFELRPVHRGAGGLVVVRLVPRR
jgi:hypothetical protein